MDRNLAQQAINHALRGKWKEAISINLKILKHNNKDIDALNRLARAYAEDGNLTKAKSTAHKVLKIDPFNKISKKSIEKWSFVKDTNGSTSPTSSAQVFFEEPGKTKTVCLMHLGAKDSILKLDSGDEVIINPHGHRITITSFDGAYIGKLPDDMSSALKNHIKYGNKYQAFVKSSQIDEVRIFIRETFRSEKLKDIPSFPAEKIDYVSFTPPELVHNKAEIQGEIEVQEEE